MHDIGAFGSKQAIKAKKREKIGGGRQAPSHRHATNGHPDLSAKSFQIRFRGRDGGDANPVLFQEGNLRREKKSVMGTVVQWNNEKEAGFAILTGISKGLGQGRWCTSAFGFGILRRIGSDDIRVGWFPNGHLRNPSQAYTIRAPTH